MSESVTVGIRERLEARGVDAEAHLFGVRNWDVSLNNTRSSLAVEPETRAVGDAPSDGESAAEESAEPELRLTGFGAVFDSDSLPIFGLFTERIKRGAFKKVLAAKPDVRLLVNHGGLPFSRTKNDSMTLAEKGQGLAFDALLADTQASEDLRTLVDGGYVDQCSFAFRVMQGGDEWSCKCGDPLGAECACKASEIIRTITEMSSLEEISVVTFPAYPAASVTAARANEPSVEQAAQASDGEQREIQATEMDTSASSDANRHKQADAIRAWADSVEEYHNVCSNQGTTGG